MSTMLLKDFFGNKPECFPYKHVWITGASSGIGQALAELLADMPINLYLSCRKQSSLERQFNKSTRANISYRCFDLEDGTESEKQAQYINQDCGGPDLVILCAGMLILDQAWNIDITTHKRLMDINYFSPVRITNTLIPTMRKRRSGHIVVISSVTGYVGTPHRSVYAASKHALQGYFEALRADLHPQGPRITIVCPGYIETGIDLRAFNGKGQLLKGRELNRPRGMPAHQCAQQIINAAQAGMEEVYIGGNEIISIYLQRFCPWLMRKVAPGITPQRMSLPEYNEAKLTSGITHYRIYGHGPKKIIILNGLSSPFCIWDQFLEYFDPDTHTLLLYDYYERGYSRCNQPKWGIDAYTIQLQELLKHIAWQNLEVNLIAYSWACGFAAHLASTQKINIQRLILIAPTYYKIQQVLSLLTLMVPVISKGYLKTQGIKPLKTETYRHAYSKDKADEYWLLIKEQCVSTAYREALIGTLQAKLYLWPNYFKSLKKTYQGEIHILLGEHDSKAPGRDKNYYMKLLNKSYVSIIPKTKHLLPFEKPKECATIILSSCL